MPGTGKRAQGSSLSGRGTFSGSKGFMSFRFQVSSFRFWPLKFQLKFEGKRKFCLFTFYFLLFTFAFWLTACSVPNLEQPECTDSRLTVKEFYSYHFGNDMKFSQENLKQ